mgnify:CR=1 FL=1
MIDEEHRFGVAHKESLKKLKAHIDILSLSATPIPRSLHMALSGLKTISLLTTPPPRKKPIDTIIARWDEGIIKRAIKDELSRDGQVIILHNRIASLGHIEEEMKEILTENKNVRTIILHGKLSGEEIEERIHAFKR